MFVQLQKDFMGKKIGERIDVSEADAQHLLKEGVATQVTDDLITPAVSKALEGAFNKFTQSLDTIVNQALKSFADTQGHARKHAIPAIFGPGNTGDPKKCFGDWALAVARHDRDYLAKHYGSEFIQYTTKAALGEASGITGGYTVPPEFYDQLISIAAEQTFIRPRAFVQPMTSATMPFPFLDVTTAQAAGVSPFFGGVQMNWTAEAQTRTETEPAFKQGELKAHELSGYTVSSNVLLQDSIVGIEKFLMNLFGRAIGWTEEYAFIQGNGVGKPLGFQKSPAYIAVARAAAPAVTYPDIALMLSNLLPSSLNNAIWIVHPYNLQDLVQLRDAANRVVWVNAMAGATEKVPGYLFGRPVFVSEKVPARGTTGDVSLIDPQMYVIGDRMQVEIAASEHVNFLKNQMTWRVVERVDGLPWLDKPVTLADGVSTVSPFVGLHS